MRSIAAERLLRCFATRGPRCGRPAKEPGQHHKRVGTKQPCNCIMVAHYTNSITTMSGIEPNTDFGPSRRMGRAEDGSGEGTRVYSSGRPATIVWSGPDIYCPTVPFVTEAPFTPSSLVPWFTFYLSCFDFPSNLVLTYYVSD